MNFHFYWSKKDVSKIEEVLKNKCKDDNIIFDPFMGSGPSLMAAKKLNLRFVGVDINELPLAISQFAMEKINLNLITKTQIKLNEVKEKFIEFYNYSCPKCKGISVFNKAIFDSEPKFITKKVEISCPVCGFITSDDYPNLLTEYENKYNKYRSLLKGYADKKLIKNSRIAVKENTYISQLFSPMNFVLLSMLKQNEYFINSDLGMIFSSVLHLCKLTDIKSQSQFLYWIPKKNILDRNIFNLVEQKINKLKKSLDDYIFNGAKKVDKFDDLLKYQNSYLLINKPIQSITSNDIPLKSIDLVITDPPYFDKIPYSEYLVLWGFFFGYKSYFDNEIVESQRSFKCSDEESYLKNVKNAFSKIYRLLKEDAELVLFFKENNFKKLNKFLTILNDIGFSFIGQEHIEKKKYTYKQNITRKSTLLGDCLLFFIKRKPKNKKLIDFDKKEFLEDYLKYYLYMNGDASISKILDNGLMRELYKIDMLNDLNNVNNIIEVIERLANWNSEDRKWKLIKNGIVNRIFYGDSIEMMKKISNRTFDCCITDPPYNISGYDDKKEIGWLKSNDYWEKKGFYKIDEKWDKFTDKDYLEFTLQWLREIKRIVKENGNIAIFGTYHNIYKIGFLIEELGMKIVNSIIWYKRNAFPNITQRMFCESTEQIIWAVNNSKKSAKKWTFNYNEMKELNNGKQMRNLWDIPMTPISQKKFGKHPAQKNLEVIDRLILALSNKNDKIIDPFMGSGTVPISCMKYNREFFGIENNYNYFLISKRRIESFKSKIKLF